MSWHSWALFAVTETVLCLTPGPAVLLVLFAGTGPRNRVIDLVESRHPERQHDVLRALGDEPGSPARRLLRTLRRHPVAGRFFTALLPQFVDPQAAVAWQVAILGATSVVIEFFVLLGYGVLAGRLTGVAGRPRFRTLANRLAGSMLIGAAIGMLRVRRA